MMFETQGAWGRTLGRLTTAFCILHSSLVLSAAPFTTRADSKKSLGPDSEKGLEKLADDGLDGKKQQLTEQLEWALGLAEKDVKITAEEKAAIVKDAEPLIEAAALHRVAAVLPRELHGRCLRGATHRAVEDGSSGKATHR